MLVSQVIHHATSHRQHTDKHRKFSEIKEAIHRSEGHIRQINQAIRNHQRGERREPSVDTSTMRADIAIPKALRKRGLVGGEKTSRGSQKSRGSAHLQDQLLKDETKRFVVRSEPHFTNPTEVVAPGESFCEP